MKNSSCDVWYVDHHNLWLDIKILLLTVKKVFIKEGISAQNHATMPFFTGNDDHEKNNILILSAGRRVELVQDFQAEAAKFSDGTKILCTDLNPKCLPPARLRWRFCRAAHFSARLYRQHF